MRSTGSAVSAPLPSPSRSSRSRIGHSPSASEGEPVRGLGRTVSGAPPGRRRPEPAARRAARRPRRSRRPGAPASPRSDARTRKPVAAARSALPATRSSGHRVVAMRCGPVDGGVDHGPLGVQGRVVDAGATADHVRGIAGRAAAPTSVAATVVLPMPMSPGTSRSAPASISSSATAPPARQRGLDLLGGQRVLAVDRPGRRGVPCAAPPPAGTPARSSSTPRSSTRTRAPCARASTVTAAPPRRNSRTISAVTCRGYAETGAVPVGDAVVAREHARPPPTPAAVGCGRALDAGQPDRELLEPAQRAQRLGQPVEPVAGPRPARPRRVAGHCHAVSCQSLHPAGHHQPDVVGLGRPAAG